MAKAVQYPSKVSPGSTCILIEGSSYEECQRAINKIMDQVDDADFSIPQKLPAGGYVAFGRYKTPDLFSNSNDEVV